MGSEMCIRDRATARLTAAQMQMTAEAKGALGQQQIDFQHQVQQLEERARQTIGSAEAALEQRAHLEVSQAEARVELLHTELTVAQQSTLTEAGRAKAEADLRSQESLQHQMAQTRTLEARRREGALEAELRASTERREAREAELFETAAKLLEMERKLEEMTKTHSEAQATFAQAQAQRVASSPVAEQAPVSQVGHSTSDSLSLIHI